MALRDDLLTVLDPARLMAGCGYPPDPWQRDLLRSGANRILLLCSRQAGKSLVSACLALHQALYVPDSLVLLLSPSLRQSGELFRDKVLRLYGALNHGVPAEAETQLQLRLRNGSRIVSLPAKEGTIRGFSRVALLVIDEAAKVPDETYLSARPFLAVSGGRLIALSTPWGQRGFFFNEWTKGGETWHRVRVPATEVPRISPEFLAEERGALGDWWYSQEYELQFRDTLDQVFASEHVRGALDDRLETVAL